MKKLSSKKELELEILYTSLIGKEIEVIDSNNKNLIRIKGTLVFESANLLHLETTNGLKKILKSQVIIKFEHNEDTFKLDCKLILGSLSNRIKKIK